MTDKLAPNVRLLSDKLAPNEGQLSKTKIHRLKRKNAITILESSTIMPFKWQRQNFLCFFCHRTFQKTDALKDHTLKHKTSSVKSAVSYMRGDESVKVDVTDIKCKLCNEPLQDLNSLIDHLQAKHDKRFAEDYGYGLIPYKLREEEYKCAICSKEFQYYMKLNQHMNVHYGNLVCETCGKAFMSQSRLRSHSLCHGAKFACKLCPKTFESLKKRNDHESGAHNRKKQIKCELCDETFETFASRRRHHISKHNHGITRRCSSCNKQFLNLSQMQRHYRSVHEKEKNFACSVCCMKFFDKSGLRKHLVKHIGARVYSCDVCSKSYARKQTLREHIMQVHEKEKRFDGGRKVV